MIRRAWLILAIATLFGVQGPLCAVACLDQATPTVATDHEDGAPCHGSEAAPPESPESSDHECKCGLLQLVRSNGDASKTLDTVKTLTAPAAVAPLRVAKPSPVVVRKWDRDRNLHPPNILLLKSSFQI